MIAHPTTTNKHLTTTNEGKTEHFSRFSSLIFSHQNVHCTMGKIQTIDQYLVTVRMHKQETQY